MNVNILAVPYPLITVRACKLERFHYLCCHDNYAKIKNVMCKRALRKKFDASIHNFYIPLLVLNIG